MAKSVTKLVQTRLKVDGKCASKLDHNLCPNQLGIDKNLKIAAKGEDRIAKSCDGAALAGLSSSYSSGFAGRQAGSCTLSQADVDARALLGLFNGIPAAFKNPSGGGKEREKCIGAVSKADAKYAQSVLKAVTKCVDAQVRAGAAGDLGPVCVGSFAGGAYVPASDSKTAASINKAIDKAAGGIQKKRCGDVPLAASNVNSMFGCFGAETAEDLKDCVVCDGWNTILSIIDTTYSETGTPVVVAGGLQNAVDLTSPGDKLLVESGTYEEEVVVLTTDLSIVGCGAHVDDRPQIVEPAVGGPFTNGVFSALNDNMLFQSLETNGRPESGIFVGDGDNVAFRDIISGGEADSLYAVSSVASSSVLVELCEVVNVTDAGIYVSQSSGIVSRWNRITDNIAGQEIENSEFAEVYANDHQNNVGGILVFTVPGPLVQSSGPHVVSHNVSVSNNLDHENLTPNDGAVSSVPSGTGIIVVSGDDNDISFNYVNNNRPFGIAIVDQQAVNALAGEDVFDQSDPTKHRTTADNHVHDNDVDASNGNDPDDDGPNATSLSAEYVLALANPGSTGNCIEDVLFGTTLVEVPGDANSCL
jgi:parallel beta-helix repeat protein